MRDQATSIIIISVLAAYLCVVFFVSNEVEIDSRDFKNYVTGAGIILNQDTYQLYDIESQIKYQKRIAPNSIVTLPFRSLPPLAIFYLPFTGFNYHFAYKVFNLFIVSIAICVYLIKREQLHRKTVLLFMGLLFLPNYLSLMQGQPIFLFLLLLVYIYSSLKSHNDQKSGLLSSLLVLRPQYTVILPFLFLMVQNPTRFFKSFLVGLVVILLLSVLMTSPQEMLNYPSFLLETETSQYGSFTDSMAGFSSFIFQFSNLININLDFQKVFILNFFVFSAVFILIKDKLKEKKTSMQFSSAILIMLPFMGHIYPHDMVLFQIPLFLVLSEFFSPIVLLSYLLINFKINYLIHIALLLSGLSVLKKAKANS